METKRKSIGKWTADWAAKNGLLVRFEDQTTSTNSLAKSDIGDLSRSPFAPVLYVAGHQTGGRGRGLNVWDDTADDALTASWSFHCAQPPQPVFSPLVGLSLYEAARKAWPNLLWSLKAPNDLYLEDRKVAGILIEVVDQGETRRAIVGVGMNVRSAPKAVPNSISIADAIGGAELLTDESWETFLKALMVNLTQALPKGQRAELDEANARSLLQALNAFPHLKETYLKVGRRGELHSKSGVIDWSAL